VNEDGLLEQVADSELPERVLRIATAFALVPFERVEVRVERPVFEHSPLDAGLARAAGGDQPAPGDLARHPLE